MHFGNNMRVAMDKRGLTQVDVAEKLGVDRTTLIYYLNKPYAPKKSIIDAFCRIVGCTPQELYGKDYGRVAIYGTIAAGTPIEAIEDIIGYVEVNDLNNTQEYFALQIKGFSMYPRMKTGDIVIFHKQSDADSGDVVAVMVGGENATCKQYFTNDKGIVLHAYNESFGDMKFSDEQVQELPIEIIGKAVELRAKL